MAVMRKRKNRLRDRRYTFVLPCGAGLFAVETKLSFFDLQKLRGHICAVVNFKAKPLTTCFNLFQPARHSKGCSTLQFVL